MVTPSIVKDFVYTLAAPLLQIDVGRDTRLFSIFNIDTFEIILFVAILCVLLVFLIAGSVMQTKAIRKRLIKRSEDIVKSVSLRLGLSERERDMLRRLESEIRGGKYKKYLLVTDPVFFNTAVHNYLQKDKSHEALIAALRIRLGFTVFSDESTVHSTADLITELPVYIVHGKNHSFHGRITGQEVTGVRIRVEKIQGDILVSGEPLRVFFAKKNGIFYFNSSILSVHGDTILIRHTEDVMKLQRRKYYRKRMKERVKIKHGGEMKSPLSTLLIDLGGDGATLWNPHKRYGENDNVVLFLTLKKMDRLALNATVVRVSHDRKYLHVKFHHIPDADRDRIFNYLFTDHKKAESPV